MVFKPRPRGLLSLKPVFRRAGVRAADCERDSSGPARKRLWPQINTEFDSHRTSDGPSPPAHPEHLRFPSACCARRLPDISERSAPLGASSGQKFRHSRPSASGHRFRYGHVSPRSGQQLGERLLAAAGPRRVPGQGEGGVGRGREATGQAGGFVSKAARRGSGPSPGARASGVTEDTPLPLGLASDRSPERFRSGFLTGSAGRSSRAVAPRHGNVRSGRVIRPRQMCSNRQGVVFLCWFFIFLFYSFILFPPTNSAVRALVSSISSKRTSRKIFAFTVLLTGGSWASLRHRPLA